MTTTEMTALAMLRGGCSYAEVSECTGLTLVHLMKLWANNK